MKYLPTTILACLGVAAALPVCADTLTVSASSDSWILTENPDGNFNGDFHGLGSGFNNHGSNMRAMFKFDLSTIPANATVNSVTVTVTEVNEKSLVSINYELHRFLQNWVASEVTWNSRSSGVTWTAPGASAGDDFTTAASATTLVSAGAFGQHTFSSTSQLVADVQGWISNPSSNYGWFFVPASYGTLNARRWGSTAIGDAPSITVDYTVSTSTPPQQPTIANVANSNNQIQFTFAAEANQSYTVETKPALDAAAWTTLTTFSAATSPTNYLVTDSISQSTKFYRVKTP